MDSHLNAEAVTVGVVNMDSAPCVGINRLDIVPTSHSGIPNYLNAHHRTS